MQGRSRRCQVSFAHAWPSSCVWDMRFTKIPYRTLTKRGLILAVCLALTSLMATLHSYPFCPHSRFVRLALAETGLEADIAEEKPWERRIPFLEMNPAGNLPLLVVDDGL